jgi:uncharacterized protein YdgA (DUF945 family)
VKRWLVVLLVLLAVIVLVSPGIVGRIAEKNLQENIEWAESEAGAIEFRTESFDRGWFSSEGRHRVIISGTAFSEAAKHYREQSGYEELPSLIIDTRLDHGLVPIASLGREAGSLTPGLASTLSTFQIDPGNGELVPLPGKLYSNVDLRGASDSRYLLEAGDFELEGMRMEWQGADVSLHTDWAGGVFSSSGRIDPLTISDSTDVIRLGAISIAADQVRSEYGFNVGTAEFTMESMELESPGSRMTVGNMSFASEAGIEDARLNVSTKTSIDEISIPGVGAIDFDFDLGLYRLDAASVQVVATAFKEAQTSADP